MSHTRVAAGLLALALLAPVQVILTVPYPSPTQHPLPGPRPQGVTRARTRALTPPVSQLRTRRGAGGLSSPQRTSQPMAAAAACTAAAGWASCNPRGCALGRRQRQAAGSAATHLAPTRLTPTPLTPPPPPRQAAFERVKLPVALNGLEPVISNKTMNFHYNKWVTRGAGCVGCGCVGGAAVCAAGAGAATRAAGKLHPVTRQPGYNRRNGGSRWQLAHHLLLPTHTRAAPAHRHYAGYITNLNAAYGSRKAPATLTEAVRSVGVAGTLNATAIRNQGGGAWNHGARVAAAPAAAAPAVAAGGGRRRWAPRLATGRLPSQRGCGSQ